MSNLEDPESVGYKVAAALSGTFLGIFLAYGLGVPLGKAWFLLIKLKNFSTTELLKDVFQVLQLDYHQLWQ